MKREDRVFVAFTLAFMFGIGWFLPVDQKLGYALGLGMAFIATLAYDVRMGDR